jgi:Flp pilus assembly protein TadG
MRNRRLHPRRGAIIPMTALLMTALIAFVALAIDLGILMIERNQCQNAADAAAMAGARTLTGDPTTNNNYSNAQPNAVAAASANSILNQPVNAATQLTVTVGDYYYSTGTNSFQISPSSLGQAGDNWTLVQATVTAQQPSFFAQALGLNSLNTTATATAAHRPRDTVIVIDFSGSMRFESLLAEPYSGARTTSMNNNPVYPLWGHYSGNSSFLTYSSDKSAPGGEVISAANTEYTTLNAPTPVINGFYADTAAFGTSTPAFTAASSTYGTTPNGDVPLTVQKNTGPGYAHTVSEFLNSSSGQTTRDWRFELDGYSAYSNGAVNSLVAVDANYVDAPFNGYTQGPGYWGKTFFLWPPDPRVPVTTTYFTNNQIQNTVKQFMNDFGFTAVQMLLPTYQYVYTNWTSWTATTLQNYLTGTPPSGLGIAATDPKYLQTMRLYNRIGTGMPKDGSANPVPCDWRARFFTTPSGAPLMDNSKLWNNGTTSVPSSSTYLINYNAILDWIKNSGTNPFPNQLRAGGVVYYTAIPSTIDTSVFPPADPNQRFWKEYIDEVLGVLQTGGSGSSPNYSNVDGYSGYGSDISWGSVASSGQPSGWPTTTYIDYTDNPKRPLLRCWFGPLTMVDFLGNYNASDPSNNNGPRLWWPGTSTEAPTYQTKLGVQGALKDLLTNHPNDNVSLVFFSSPRSSPSATGYYNYSRVPLGRNERLAYNSLWFSPKVIKNNAEINVYNSSGVNPGDIYDVPRANGGTCYTMALMLAYNQFSANSTLVNYTANAPAGTAGGLGRNGADKLLVFETDGMVNTGCSATLISSTTGQGYYKVRVADANNWSASGTEFPTGVGGVTFSTGATQSQGIATQICASLASGGFSTTRKPVKIQCIAFGSLFEPTNTASNKTNALQNLATLEVIGSVQSAGATTLASNKIIVGDFNTRITNLQAAFTSIMEDGMQVTLISSGAGKP